MAQEEFEHPRDYVNAAEGFLKGENEPHPEISFEISGESMIWLRAYLDDLLSNINRAAPVYKKLTKGRRLWDFLEQINQAGQDVRLRNASHPSKTFPEKVSLTTNHQTIRQVGLTMPPHEYWNNFSIVTQLGTKYLAYQAFLEMENSHEKAGGKPNPDLKRYFSGQLDQLADRYKE